ncbi:hypothetical protein GS507_25585 [Rhodococcus hoagii]|nr:hypothetical protein [Prescottella equi]
MMVELVGCFSAQVDAEHAQEVQHHRFGSDDVRNRRRSGVVSARTD